MNTRKINKSNKRNVKNEPKKTINKNNTITKTVKAKGKYIDFKEKKKIGDPLPKFNDNAIRLNKYLSNAGICSRREADVLIQTGVVSVNDKIITELGYKVAPTDIVKYDGQTLRAETKRYVLLNKPKGFVSTQQTQGQKTIFSLVKKACKEQIFPIGKLEKDTTGLILFTNDTDIAKKLTHPQHKAKQIYAVEVDKPMSTQDMQKLTQGVLLEDGTSKFESIEYVGKSTRQIGVEIKNTKHQIVRRTIEMLGYKVIKLDRTVYAGLTKKDLPRGYYRHLTPEEVITLKVS